MWQVLGASDIEMARIWRSRLINFSRHTAWHLMLNTPKTGPDIIRNILKDLKFPMPVVYFVIIRHDTVVGERMSVRPNVADCVAYCYIM